MSTRWSKMTPEQKEKAKQRGKEWREKNTEKVCARKRKHYHENRDKYLRIERERAYKKLYGITIEDYDKMFEEQGGRCAICKSDKSIKGGKSEVFAVDHCHETGEVRGLLCIACNALLGRYEKYKDEINDYLKPETNTIEYKIETQLYRDGKLAGEPVYDK